MLAVFGAPAAAVPASACVPPWHFEQRILPARSDGRASGFELVGVVRGSPLFSLGVRHGDVLRTVNEEPITTVEAVIDVVILVATGAPLKLVVERRGERLTLERIDGEQPAWWLAETVPCMNVHRLRREHPGLDLPCPDSPN